MILMRNYIRCFPKVISLAITAATASWANSGSHEVQLSSFILLEKMAKMDDVELQHKDIVKTCFSEYVKKSAGSTVDTLQKIAFMQQCLIQLLALDLNLTYKMTFDSLKSIVLLIKAVGNDKKNNKKDTR